MRLVPIVPFLALSLALTGCPPAAKKQAVRTEKLPRPADPNAAVQAEFDQAFNAFADSKWAEAERLFAAVVAKYPQSALVAEARYRRGVALNRQQKFADGRAALREFLEKHPTSPYAKQAAVELGLAEAKLGNKQDAEQILRPVMNDPNALTAEERKEMEPAISEVIKAGSATVEAIRRAAQGAEGGDAAAKAELERLVDTQASFLDMAQLYEEGDESSPAWPLVCVKMARIYYHLGDFDRAKQAADKALSKGAGGYEDRVRQVQERIALRGQSFATKVGVILPLTGRFKSYGEAIQDGIGLAISKRDGIDVVIKDSQGDPDLAAQMVEQLAKEGAVVVIGPVGVAEAPAAALRAQELGIPMISLSRAEGLTGIGPYVFRNSLTNSQQGRALARYATEVLGVKAAAVLAPDIASGEEVTGAFWEGIEGAGGEIRGYETYEHDQTTFSRTIKKLVARNNLEEREDFKAEVNRIIASEPNPYKRKKLLEKLAGSQAPVVDFDVLLVPDYWKSVGLVAPALAVEDVITNGCDVKEIEKIKKTTKRDVKTVTLLGTAGWNSPDLVNRAGKYVQCAVFVDGFYVASAREQTKKFVEEFEEQFNRKPALLEAQGYDTARIVKEIVQKFRPQNRDAFRQALMNVRRFPGVTGETTFSADREADKPLFFLTVDRGAIMELGDVRISPAGVAVPPKPVP